MQQVVQFSIRNQGKDNSKKKSYLWIEFPCCILKSNNMFITYFVVQMIQEGNSQIQDKAQRSLRYVTIFGLFCSNKINYWKGKTIWRHAVSYNILPEYKETKDNWEKKGW